MAHIRPDETVRSALRLSDRGVSDAANAEIHAVAVKTIRRWRREYQRRGKPRGQAHCNAPCPLCHSVPLDEEAYAHLLGWYLGDGYLIEGRRGVYALSVYNDMSYVNLSAETADTLPRVKPGGRPHVRNVPGCLVTTMSWKHWPCLIPQHGPGRKHNRPIVLEDWQRDVLERQPGRLLRGLFHSDGCRFTNWTSRVVNGKPKRYEYPRYMFTNKSADILALCGWALDLLQIEWRMANHKNLSVAKRDSVRKLDEHVGPKS
jgi:hypothetical protein